MGVGKVRSIIEDYVGRDASDFARAEVGFHLDEEERRRRHVLQSLLRVEGLDARDYAERFGAHPMTDLAEEFGALAARGWLVAGEDSVDAATIRLTEEGPAHSDAIGPDLFSTRVNRLMAEYETG